MTILRWKCSKNVPTMKTILNLWLHKNTFEIFTFRGLASWKKEYSERKVTGFTVEQMFEVVSDVENYYKFLPFCQKSIVNKKSENELLGELQVGFPPLVESYVSKVTLQRPHLVKADCTDGRLFHHLTTTWRFSEVKNESHRKSKSCKVYFYLSFEFKSLLHSQIANVFFDQLVTQMQTAFFKEAHRRYGLPSSRKSNTDAP